MADKKITALTELTSTGKDATDLLHIIDYSASPVNKKITLANLFARIDTPVSSVGTSNFEFGPTTAISGFKVNIPHATPSSSNVTEVVVNENGNEFVDFRVESNNSAQAIFVDSSDVSSTGNSNIVFINGDAGNVDFCVKGDNFSSTNPVLFSDGSVDALGIGTNAVNGNFTCQIAKDPTTGHALELQGNLCFGATPDDLTGAASGSKTVIPVTSPVSHLTADGATNCHFSLADGVEGQIKILCCKAVPNSGTPTVTPANFGTTGDTTIVMNAVGESVMLMFTNARWNMLGYGKGVV